MIAISYLEEPESTEVRRGKDERAVEGVSPLSGAVNGFTANGYVISAYVIPSRSRTRQLHKR